MNCPDCKTPKMKVTLTRNDDAAVWRRRKCDACGQTLTTAELYSKTAMNAPMPPHRPNRKAKT